MMLGRLEWSSALRLVRESDCGNFDGAAGKTPNGLREDHPVDWQSSEIPAFLHGTPSASCQGNVTSTRAKAFAVVLVTSVLMMTTVSLFAAPSHEVCDAMGHACAKVEASCCCGDSSDSNPSRVPSERTSAGTDSTHSIAVASVAFNVPAVIAMFVHDGPPPLAGPLDLRILFSDLRI